MYHKKTDRFDSSKKGSLSPPKHVIRISLGRDVWEGEGGRNMEKIWEGDHDKGRGPESH